MVSFKIKLKKRIIFLISAVFIIVVAFISISIYQWSKLAKEEYFYSDAEKLYKKLNKLPSDLNIENIKKIKSNVDPSHFKFVVMSDNKGHHTIFKKAIKDALTHNPDFIIHLGDLTKNGMLRHYKEEVNFIKKNIPIPFVFIVGNHDYYSNGFISYAHIFGPLDFYFEIGEYRFICMDNCFIEKIENFVYLPDSDMEWEGEPGIDDDKMEKLEKLLQKGSYSNLIFMHYPPPLDSWGKHSFGQNGKNFLDLLEKYNSIISYVCASHIHGFDEKRVGETKLIVSGGLGAELSDDVPGVTESYNYVLFEVDETGIKEKAYFIVK